MSGWIRREGRLEKIDETDGWVSPHLSIRFESKDALRIFRPDGSPFLTFVELFTAREQDKVQHERERAERLAVRLKEMGVNPDDV